MSTSWLVRAQLLTVALVLAGAGLLSTLTGCPGCSAEDWMCVCGELDRETTGVVEGQVMSVLDSVAEIRVRSAYGTAAENWSVGETLEVTVGFDEVDTGEYVLVLTDEGEPNWVQPLDESGAPVCFADVLPLTVEEAADLALRSDCRDQLRSRWPPLTYELEPTCE